jgi:DNA repair exonuclease SbcCD nuclease subunit
VKRIAATQISADLRIGVVHANVAGVAGHDNYGPCNTSDLQQSDIHYWALGHIHKQQSARSTFRTRPFSPVRNCLWSRTLSDIA